MLRKTGCVGIFLGICQYVQQNNYFEHLYTTSFEKKENKKYKNKTWFQKSKNLNDEKQIKANYSQPFEKKAPT